MNIRLFHANKRRATGTQAEEKEKEKKHTPYVSKREIGGTPIQAGGAQQLPMGKCGGPP